MDGKHEIDLTNTEEVQAAMVGMAMHAAAFLEDLDLADRSIMECLDAVRKAGQNCQEIAHLLEDYRFTQLMLAVEDGDEDQWPFSAN